MPQIKISTFKQFTSRNGSYTFNDLCRVLSEHKVQVKVIPETIIVEIIAECADQNDAIVKRGAIERSMRMLYRNIAFRFDGYIV